MVMPSEMAIVLNSMGVPPAARMPSFTFSAERAQMKIAGRHFGPRVGDGDQRPRQIGVGQPGGLQHRPRRRP